VTLSLQKINSIPLELDVAALVVLPAIAPHVAPGVLDQPIVSVHRVSAVANQLN
jgi:hypothetical protein